LLLLPHAPVERLATHSIRTRIELLSTVGSAEVWAKSLASSFLLDKSSGVLEYLDEDLFDDPSGKDIGNWN
jgi:hypothetical protein